jgi:hypothetical protein
VSGATLVDETLRRDQHPTEVRIGVPDESDGQCKTAAIIANDEYESPYSELTTAPDASAMAGALKSEQYEVPSGVEKNLTASALEKSLMKPLQSEELNPGDDVVLYFAGHPRGNGGHRQPDRQECCAECGGW